MSTCAAYCLASRVTVSNHNGLRTLYHHGSNDPPKKIPRQQTRPDVATEESVSTTLLFDFMRSLITDMDFRSLEVRLFKAKISKGPNLIKAPSGERRPPCDRPAPRGSSQRDRDRPAGPPSHREVLSN
ncbi:hypothetical protein EYF80_051499 [Liparis tanakae]|uniref:Uncharacterized protein n=1 Tax=Liparis tanakae TaxID=230148 RepID=A0A4Z2FD88_9TELE|nr:hypothetical protein EYF80_051499 [Liparis tanakae]